MSTNVKEMSRASVAKPFLVVVDACSLATVQLCVSGLELNRTIMSMSHLSDGKITRK